MKNEILGGAIALSLVIFGVAPAAAVGDSAAAVDEVEATVQEASSAPLSTEATPIGELIDNPETKSIVDRYIPGLTENPQIEMARNMTLRQANSYAPEQVPEEALDQIDVELAELPR